MYRNMRGGHQSWFDFRVEADEAISHSEAMEEARFENPGWKAWTGVIPVEDRDDDEMTGWSFII